MNIEINLLPEELRPRPPVETKTLLFVVIIVVLVAGCALLIMAKSSTNADITTLEQRIAAVEQETISVSTNPEAVALTNSISNLKTAKAAYNSFIASRVSWGDALERVRSHIPTGVDIRKLTQSGNTLVVDGTTSGFSAVSSYGRALDRDAKLTLGGMPSLTGTTYSLVVSVAPGGAG
jgi:Tfp pilus assembly protein PilN